MFWGQKQTVGSLWCAGGSAAHAHGSAGRSSAGECWLRPNCSSQPPSLDALLLTCDIFPASASLCCRRLGFGFGGWACRSDSLEIDVFKLCTTVQVQCMSWVDVVEVKNQLPQPNFTFSVSLGAVENREAEVVEVEEDLAAREIRARR